MSRPYRLQGENCFYHITSRGDDRKSIFISDYDYNKFLHYLLNAKTKYNFYLYAYVLMNNHYHLLIETTQPNLAKIMHYINSAYTTYYNIKRHKYGHVFQGRYKSIVVDKDNYLFELTRYIHLNPVRAKMVQRPEEYKWSSYQGYLKKAGDGYIDKGQIKESISLPPEQYQQFVMNAIGDQSNPLKDVYAGFILGKTSFIKEKLKDIKAVVAKRDFSYKGDLQERISSEEIMEIITKKYGKSLEELRQLKKYPVKEKKIAVYLMKKLTNLSNREIGEQFGLSYSAVSKAAGSVEREIGEEKRFQKEVEELISHFKA